MLNTFGHELYHHIEKWSPTKARQLAEFLCEEMGISSVEAMVERRIKKAEDAGHGVEYFMKQGMSRTAAENIVRKRAFSDFVADSLETVFTQGNAMEVLQRLSKKDKGLVQRIKDFIDKWVQKLREFYNGNRTISLEGHIASQLKTFEKMQEMFMEALSDAGENYHGALTPGVEGTVVNENGDPVAFSTEDGTVQLSMRTYEESGRDAFRGYLEKCVESKRLNQTEMQEMLDGIEDIYQTCKEFKDNYAPFSAWSDAAVVRDTHGKPVFSVVTPNSEYKMNLDFSLVCKKRRTLDAVFNEMSRRGIIDDFELGQKSVVKINEIIRQYGLETACALCFVDAKRFRQASMADQFTRLYNELVESLVPEDQKSSIDHFNFAGYETIKKVDGGIDTWNASKLDFSHLDHVMKTYGSKTVEYKAAKYIKTHAEGRKLLLRGDFMSSGGFDAVKSQNEDILKLYNAKKGTGGPKAAFGDVQYMNEIIQKARWWTPAKAYSVGGVRVQSFSDYVPRMVFDYVQMVYDLAATKLPAHAYSKESLFVQQFGLTGVKINMSLIPAVAKDGIAAGLDAYGNYVWAGETFDFETAKKIQNAPGYTENCGTICVGVSKKHIEKLLSDPDIRMVIPYHKSGLNPIVAHMNRISAFEDYTDHQRTKADNGNGKAIAKEFDFYKALSETGDPKAAANQYLQWCADRHYRPKFSEFAWHPNYYKLLIDFTVYDKNGKYVPQREVKAVFPKSDAAFGDMRSLIEAGLEEDAVIEGRREANLSAIVDEIQRTIPKIEAEIDEVEVDQADRDVEDSTEVQKNTADGGDEHFSFRNSNTGMANDALIPYNEEWKALIEGRGDVVVDSFEKLEQIVNLAFDEPTRKLTAYFGIIDPQALAKIEKEVPNVPNQLGSKLFKTGRQYSIAASLDSIRHLVDSKSAMTRVDVLDYLDRLADTIVERDAVYFDYYTDSRNNKLKGLRFKKTFSDGTIVSFQIVSNKKMSMNLQTMFMDKPSYQKKKSAKPPLMQNAPAHTPEVRGSQTSTKRIAHSNAEVKIDSGDQGVDTFSDRNPTEISNRTLLVNALESTTQTDWEKKKLQEYKAKLADIEATEQKLLDTKKQIYEMSFATGPRDDAYKAKLRKHREDALHAQKRLDILDKQLLRLEAMKPVADILKREREAAKRREKKRFNAQLAEFQEAAAAEMEQRLQEAREKAAKQMANLREKHYKDRQKALEAQRTGASERRNRTELRKKIRKDIRDLTKMFKRGKDERNVKEEMKDLVAATIAQAEAIFIDYYTDDDIIRNGVSVDVYSDQSAMLNEAHDILKRLDNPPEGIYDDPAVWGQWNMEERHLRNRLNSIKTRLKEVFAKERNKMEGTTAAELMNGVFKAYKELASAEKEYIRNAYDPQVLEHLQGISENLGNVKARDMSLRQLEDLHKAYTMVIHTIRNANKAFTESKSVEQLAKTMVSELKGSRKVSKNKAMNMARNAANLMGWNYEKLYYALERVGSDTLTRLFNNLANSENIVMQDAMEAKEKQLDLIDRYGYNDWAVNKQIDKDFVDNHGKTFRMTLGEMMLLYAYVRRGTVDKQLEIGGFVFGEKDLMEELKKTDTANTYKLTREQCISITNTLTEEQKNFVADMQTYLSDVMGAKGNEVSMLLYGVELFGEKNYMPVHVAGEYMARAEEAQAKNAAGFGTMKNAGFTNSKNVEAKAPIVLESFVDVWVDHVNEMSRYHGTVPALEDIRRVMNYSVYNDANTDSMSVKAALENGHGKNAVNYFDSLYREANSGAVLDKMQGFSKQALAKMRKLGVAYSLSVVVQQPASLVRAYAMIDKKYFGNIRIPVLRGNGTIPVAVVKTALNKWTQTQTKAYAEMLKYAPGVTMAKEIGGFDTASGSSIRTYLMDTDKSLKQKLKNGTATERAKAVADMVDDNPVANVPNLADKMTWIEIWNACKGETAAKHKYLTVGSEAFMKRVGDRFTEVIRATQVYDSIFAKSPMLKSKNAAVQYLVSFMNEPNVVVNMVESAIRDFRQGNRRQAARKLTAVARSIIFTCALKSIVYALRDDDEDETFIEKYVQALVSNLIGDFTGFNYIPIVADIWSLAQGYDVERPDIAIFADVIQAARKYYNVQKREV